MNLVYNEAPLDLDAQIKIQTYQWNKQKLESQMGTSLGDMFNLYQSQVLSSTTSPVAVMNVAENTDSNGLFQIPKGYLLKGAQLDNTTGAAPIINVKYAKHLFDPSDPTFTVSQSYGNTVPLQIDCPTYSFASGFWVNTTNMNVNSTGITSLQCAIQQDIVDQNY